MADAYGTDRGTVMQLPDGTWVTLPPGQSVGNFAQPQVPLVPPTTQSVPVPAQPSWTNYSPNFTGITAAQMQAPVVGGMFVPQAVPGMRGGGGVPTTRPAQGNAAAPPGQTMPPTNALIPPLRPGAYGANMGALAGAPNALQQPRSRIDDYLHMMLLLHMMQQPQQPNPFALALQRGYM